MRPARGYWRSHLATRSGCANFGSLMKTSLESDGFELHRAVFGETELESLRVEADHVSVEAEATSVRLLCDRSSLFRSLSKSLKLRSLAGSNRIPVRSILFDKTPDENWPVLWHQDLTIAVAAQADIAGYLNWSVKNGLRHVQPPVSLLSQIVTVRIHLDDTPALNGALKVIPGSHCHGRMDQKAISSFVEKADEVVCEAAAGDVLLMSPLILHSSARSEQPSRRRVLHFEYAIPESLDPNLEWHERSA